MSEFNRGFTIVEMLVVLAVIATLTSVAVPSLTALQKRNRMAAEINTLSVALRLTRNEALKRGETVEICAARPDASDVLICDDEANWQQGWIIYPQDSAAQKIRLFNGFSGHDDLRSLGDHKTMAFNRYGFSSHLDTLVLCPSDRDTSKARALLLERSGRLEVAVDSDENGIVDDIDGDDVTCPE